MRNLKKAELPKNSGKNGKDDKYNNLLDVPPVDERQLRVKEYKLAWYLRARTNSSTNFMIDSKEG